MTVDKKLLGKETLNAMRDFMLRVPQPDIFQMTRNEVDALLSYVHYQQREINALKKEVERLIND